MQTEPLTQPYGTGSTFFLSNHLQDAVQKSTHSAVTASVVHTFCLKTDPENTSTVEFTVQSNSRKVQ